MANKTYIGLHPNNLNRTKYGEITLYVEGEPAAFFSGSSNVTFSGSLGIQGIADVSASIASLQSAGTPTLQQVTDAGNTTTTTILVGAITASGNILTSEDVLADTGYFQATNIQGITTTGNLQVTNVLNAGTDTDKFLVLDANGNVDYRTGAEVLSDIGALGAYTETQTLDDVTTLGNTTTNNITAGIISGSVLESAGNMVVGTELSIGYVDNPNADVDKFLVLDNGVVKGRTGAEVASDIGAITVQPTLQNVAAAGNTITGSINIGIGSTNPTLKLVVIDANEYKIRAGYPYSGGRYLDIGYQAINIINPAYNEDFQIKIDGDTKLYVGPDAVASSGSLSSGKKLFVSAVDNAATDTDKFLVLNGTEIEYRTGAQVLSDIGGAAANINLQDVTDNGNVTTNDIIAAKLSGSSLEITGDGEIAGNLVVGGIVTAQEFHTEFVSASIIYQSGSTKFGDTSDDKHAFTGSVSIKDVPNADGDRDKFLVVDATGKIEYRSGSQVLEDIGGTQSTFDGERGITQTLLPSLLNFNPQTTTVEDFLDAVFYPPSPEDFNILSNEPFSALESQESGSIVHSGNTGIGTTQAQFSIDTNAVITWSLQSTGIFKVDSSTGKLSLNTDFSGSATFQAPKTLTGTVVATSNLGSIKTAPFTVTVVENAAPTITFQTISPNNNKTTGATGFGTITITDLPQGVDTVSIDSLGGADASSFTLNSPTEGVTTVYILSSSAALNSGSYSLDVTGSDSYDNVVSASFTVSVAENFPPIITQTGFSSETTQATSGSNIGTITVTDLHDSITAFSFTGTDAALFNPIEISSTATSKTFNVQPFNDLAAGSFNITGSGTDAFGFTTLEPIENAFTLPVPGTPIPNNGFYIIESALSGSAIVTNSNGFSGTTGSFSSNQAGTWSITGTNFLAINQSGELTLKANLSGSTTQAPGTLGGNVKITNNDGVDSDTVTVSVTLVENLPATITPNLTLSYNEAQTTGAIGLGTITVTDPQAYENVEITDFTGQSITLSTETAAQSVVYQVSSSGALTQGSYTLQVTASDSYGQDTKALYTFVVAENLAPTVSVLTTQPIGFFKEITSVTSGSEYGRVIAADPQTDSIVDFSITGTSASLFDAVEVASTATSKTFSIRPFNNLVGGIYDISGSARDSFGLETTSSIANEATLPIPSAPGTNGSFSIIESAESGSAIFTNANGFNGTVAKFTTNQPVVWTIEGSITNTAGDPILAVSQSGELSIQEHLSGSSIQAGDTLTGTVRATNTFGESSTANISVAVRDNVPATITNNVTTTKKEAEVSTAIGLGTVVIADPQLYENVQWINFDGGGNFVTSSESPGQSVTYEVSSSGALTNGTYTFAITASDSYGQLTKQLHTLVVSENLPPTITYSGFTGTVDNATSGSEVGTATVVDPDAEGIASFILTGTDAALFNVIQKSSSPSQDVYGIEPFNNLSAGTFDITGSAEDDFGLTANEPIPNSFTLVAPAPIGSNDPFSIIESALSGSFVTSATNGVAGTKAKFTNAQPVTWSLQNTNVLAINQSGELSVNTDISGAYFAPGPFTATVVATNDGGSVTAPVSVTIVDNGAPTFSDTIQTAINTADITSARGIGTITLTDPLSGISYENVEIDTFVGDSNFVISTETAAPSVAYQISSSGAVTAGTYTLQFTGSDEYGNVVKTSKNVVVSTAAAAPIQKNGNLFIIESAESGSHITTSTDGIPGTQVQFTTTTPGVTWSVSPTTYLHIDNTGKLSLQAHVSGVLDDTNTIDATVTAGTGASPETTLQISVDITPNLAPTVTDTVPATISDTVAVANATLGTITAIDPQALDAIDSITITGGASQSEVTLGTFSQTTNSGSVDLKVGGSNMAAGAKVVQVTATDSFGQETVHNINFTVGSTPATQVFIYTNTVNAANLNSTTTQALTALGALYYEQFNFADTGYALDQLIGASDFAQDFTATGTSYGSGVLDFIASGSIDDLLDMQTFGNIPTSTTGKQVVYLFPSSSDMSSLPSTIAAVADLNNIPSGQHALVSYAQTPPVSPTGDVFYFTTTNPVHGYSDWGIAFTLDRQTGTNRWAIAASGDTIPS